MVVLTKNQREIIELFRKNLFLKTTILQLMKILKKKSYQRVYEAIKELEKANIVIIVKIGNSSLVEIAKTEETAINLAYIEEKEAISKKIPNIKELLDISELADDILIISGSYAKETQTKNSDTDLVVITKEDAFKKAKLIENRTLTFSPEVHPLVITKKDFIDMLLSKEHNFGKEVFKYHLILKNARRYYEIIFEAIKNGFIS